MIAAHEGQEVPIYLVTAPDGRVVPLVVTLLLVGPDLKPRLPGAVVVAIDHAAAVTGREGVCSCIVSKEDGLLTVKTKVDKALNVPQSIVLMLCQTTGAAERAFRWIREIYSVSHLEG
ncbi:hypothetical protein CEK28_00010 [Xenophilus sp. AP218F]|nr:hypothetical protein CEK28_00010 [Xenophilus sp. AP218F]